MRAGKVRHQLLLSSELSARVEGIAKGTGRARSQVLVDAVESWLCRRNPEAIEDVLQARLTRIERHIEAVRRQQGLQWEVLARMLRHQLLTAAGLPPADAAAQAIAQRAFEAVIDELAERLAGKPLIPAADPALDKVRAFQ
jgi:predicted transcriptional regulator